MKGRIKMYNENKGFGFILGEDEEDYFFHISKVKSVTDIKRGMIVEFEASSNEKGKLATNIHISKGSMNRPDFIVFGDTRIKTSNIKNYGISKEQVYYEKVYTKKDWGIGAAVLNLMLDGGKVRVSDFNETSEWIRFGRKEPISAICIKDSDGSYKWTTLDIGCGKYEQREEKYLYVTVFQGDNYTFNEKEANFNIYEKCKEMDAFFS